MYFAGEVYQEEQHDEWNKQLLNGGLMLNSLVLIP